MGGTGRNAGGILDRGPQSFGGIVQRASLGCFLQDGRRTLLRLLEALVEGRRIRCCGLLELVGVGCGAGVVVRGVLAGSGGMTKERSDDEEGGGVSPRTEDDVPRKVSAGWKGWV